MLGCFAAASFAISCAAPATHAVPTEPALHAPPLGRFMRESVNVPFAFVMLETATHHRGKRVHKAATFLHDAARDLVDWAEPPTQTAEAREVFYTYAEHLVYHAARLEHAAAQHETELANDTVEDIRQTCNDCHHFFRPAAKFSPDVAYDRDAFDLGGYR